VFGEPEAAIPCERTTGIPKAVRGLETVKIRFSGLVLARAA